jgi:hypothetical protein
MNRNLRAPAATITAVVVVVVALVAVVVGISLRSDDRPAGGPAGPGAREAFGFDAAYADSDPMVVVVRYGDSSSCPSTGVRHDAVQEATRVVVTLTRTPMPSDRPCTSDYGARLVRVALTAPLGGREVIDGSRKQPVPISTGLPPFG